MFVRNYRTSYRLRRTQCDLFGVGQLHPALRKLGLGGVSRGLHLFLTMPQRQDARRQDRSVSKRHMSTPVQRRQQEASSRTKLMADEPTKPKGTNGKPEPASMSVFEWAMELESEKK